MNIEQERADFEAWAKGHYILQRSAYNDTYIDVPTMRAWEVWQARAALASQASGQAAPQKAAPSDGEIEALALTEHRPLFGHKSGKREKTHWLTFMKPPHPTQHNDGGAVYG